MPSRYEPAHVLRELLNKWMFLGTSAPNEREENIVKYVIHPILEDVCPVQTKGCARHEHGGSENAQT